MAITEDKIRQLFEMNAQFGPELDHERDYEPSGFRPWAGWRKRVMMSMAYAIAFLCLLRLDEVLNIKIENFEIIDEKTGKTKLVLDFRKTAQGGGQYFR